jgi:hypothetical protein
LVVALQRRSRNASAEYIDNLQEQVPVTAVLHRRARDRTPGFATAEDQ